MSVEVRMAICSDRGSTPLISIYDLHSCVIDCKPLILRYFRYDSWHAFASILNFLRPKQGQNRAANFWPARYIYQGLHSYLTSQLKVKLWGFLFGQH